MATAALALSIMPAFGDELPPPPIPDPDPEPSTSTGSNTSNGRGNRMKGAIKKAIVNGAVCTIGGIILDNVDELDSSALEKVANSIVCTIAGAVIPIPGLGGFFGKVANYTICCKKTSIIVRILRPDGLRCTLDDLWVAGCPEYLLVNGTKAQKKVLRTSTSPYVVAARLRLATTQ